MGPADVFGGLVTHLAGMSPEDWVPLAVCVVAAALHLFAKEMMTRGAKVVAQLVFLVGAILFFGFPPVWKRLVKLVGTYYAEHYFGGSADSTDSTASPGTFWGFRT